MHRSKLKIFLINTELKKTGKLQKAKKLLSPNLLHKTRTEYFQKLNVKDLSYNRKF